MAKFREFCKNGHDMESNRFFRKGISLGCYECKLIYSREYRKNNRDYFKFHDRKSVLKRQFGMSMDDYAEMHKKQNGSCYICGNKNKNRKVLSVDHNHTTKKVRKLLCVRCNTSIGLLNEDPLLMGRVIEYLKEHRSV